MKTLAGIIVVITVLAVSFIIFFLYFMPTEWEISLLLMVVRIQALMRGVVIDIIWKVAAILIGLTTAYLLWAGRSMISNPVTAAILAGIIAAIVGGIIGATYHLQTQIPWVDIKIPTLELGKKEGIAANELTEKVVGTVLDCWYAFQANKYDPLAGVPGYHPRRCVTIHFNLSRLEDFETLKSNISDYLLPAPGAVQVEGFLGQEYKVYRAWNQLLGRVKVTKEGDNFRIWFSNGSCENDDEVSLGSTTILCGYNFSVVGYDEEENTYRLIIGDYETLGNKTNLQFYNFEGQCKEGYIYIEYGDCGGWGAHSWYSPSCGIDEDTQIDCSKGDFVAVCLRCEQS